jgi:predicted nucleic acid-binding protein
MQGLAREALRHLTVNGSTLGVAPQNLIEFWAVATRPRIANGLGLTPAQAVAELANMKAAFGLLPETAGLFPEWERICTTYNVQGKQSYDARLVAVMKVHGVARILTFNTADFVRYAAGESITVLEPSSVPAPLP